MANSNLRSRTVTRKIGPNISPEVKLFGDWARTRHLTETIGNTIEQGAMAGQEAAAQKLRNIVKMYIRTGGAGIQPAWPPYSEKYRKYKEKRGWNKGFYRATDLYYNSIDVWSNGKNYYVGLKAGVRHPTPNSPTLAYIARVMETGSTKRNIQPRPLWTPSFRKLGGNRGIKAIMMWHIRDQIYKTYGIRAKVTL